MSTQKTAALNSSILKHKSRRNFSLRGDSLDGAGMVASSLCALHCAVLPLVISLLPLSAIGILANERTEWLLLGVTAAFGAASLCLGFREHRSRRALGILALGLVLLLSGRMLEQASHHEEHYPHAHEETHADVSTHMNGHTSTHKHHSFGLSVTLMVLGGLGLAAAHLVNRRLCIACRQCSSHQTTPHQTPHNAPTQGCSHG